MTKYREGDAPDVAEETINADKASTEATNSEIPLTAVLLLKYKHGTEAIRELPWIKTEHMPSMREIRTMCSEASSDADSYLIALKMTEYLTKAAEITDNKRRNNKPLIHVPRR